MEIKNLKKTAERIKRAVKNRERIIIYGDADMDGVCSVIILKDSIKSLGGKVDEVYFLDRENEGYGINITALEKLKDLAPALFISMDCGIGNIKEIDIAKKIGFEVIVIDHHIVPEELPKADIIVDPKQKGDRYPFKEFATAGIAYRLSLLLLGDKMTESLRRDILELAAMATIADMMPKTDDNEEIIIEGLSSLKDSWRPGIQALLSLENIQSSSLIDQVIKMNSLLNIRDVKSGNPAAFQVLTISDIDEAGRLAEKLLEQSAEKKRKIKEVVEEIERRISLKKEKVIFEGDSRWELILLGVASSILTKRYNKPVFLYRKDKEDSQGSVRAPKEGYNVVEAMDTCKSFLVTYGGHPPAAGFRVKNEDLKKFKECLIDYYE